MKLQDMKNEAGDASFDYCSPCCGPGQAYPYGLTLELNDETCEKLGISKALTPGTKVSIQATAIVTRASEEIDRDGDGATDICLSLQITDMGLQKSGSVNNAADVLYPKN